jgi:hypothetical protein
VRVGQDITANVTLSVKPIGGVLESDGEGDDETPAPPAQREPEPAAE